MKKLTCLLLIVAFIVPCFEVVVVNAQNNLGNGVSNVSVVSVESSEQKEGLTTVTTNNMSTIEEFDIKKPLTEILFIDRTTANLTYSYVANVHGVNQFILFEGDNSYFIYDTFLEKIVEYSTAGRSIWQNNQTVKVYNGPSQYLFHKDGLLINAYNQESFNINMSIGFDTSKAVVSAQSARQAINNDSKSITQKNLESLSSQNTRDETGPNYENVSFFGGKYIIEEEYVDYAYYFRNAILPCEYNTNDSCGYVALALLLTYYDTFYNDDIVPNQIPKVVKSPNWNISNAERALSYYAYNKYFDVSEPTWEENTIDPQQEALLPSQELHDYLFTRNEPDAPYSNGAWCADLLRATNNFLSEVSHLGSNTDFEPDWGLFTTRYSKIRQGIPLVMGMLKYSYLRDDLTLKGKSAHYVVAYGFRRTSNDEYYNVHMGWQDGNHDNALKSADTWVNICIAGDYVYMEGFDEIPHKCSANYKHAHNGCTVSICPRNGCYQYKFKCVSVTDSAHTFKCKTCNNVVSNTLDSHVYTGNTYYNSSAHYENCKYCSYVKTTAHYKKFATKVSNQQHKITCDCGYAYPTEAHNMQILYSIKTRCMGRYECASCGYSETAPIDHTLVVNTQNGSGTYHNHVCTACEQEFGCDIISITTGENSHDTVCTHGYQVLNEPHIYTTTNTKHYCAVCDHFGLHTYSNLFNFTAETHSQFCESCSYEFAFPHMLTFTNVTDTTHTESCFCGYNLTLEHPYGAYESMSETLHIRYCSCGRSQTGLHMWVPGKFGSTTCLICGAINGQLAG